ncbi:MAG TPA: PqqD family protein [Longimicrobiales bacterium]|nr:PqqD family protein [Longimicrobiales bacterium]
MNSREAPRIRIDDVVFRSPDLLSAELDAEVILLDAEAGRYFALDGVGRVIWEAIDPSARVAELCAAVLARFEVDEATCVRDVLAFLEQLADRKLIGVRPGG